MLGLNAHVGAAPTRRSSRPGAAQAAKGRPFRVRATADAPESPADVAVWGQCREKVVALGFGPDEADLILKKAHGWKFQGYWRHEKDHEVPCPEQLDARIAYLRSLGIDEEKLNNVVRKFPEVVGVDVETRMKPNVAHLATTFRMSGEVLAGTVGRKPHILGNTVDCAGDCVGECNRCWARF